MSSPTLENWLGNLGLSKLHSALQQLGITSPDDLGLLSDTEVEDVLEELQLPRRSRLKFTVAIRKLGASKPHQTIVITPEENLVIKQLNSISVKAQEALKNVQAMIQKTETSATTSSDNVKSSFAELRKVLAMRERELLDSIENDAKSALETLRDREVHVTKILSQCLQAKNESNKLLKGSRLSNVDDLVLRESALQKNLNHVINAKVDDKLVLNPGVAICLDLDAAKKMIVELGNPDDGIEDVPHPPRITRLEGFVDRIKISWESQVEENHMPKEGAKLPEIFRYNIQLTESESKSREGVPDWSRGAICEAKEQSYTFKELKSACYYEVAIRAMNDVTKTWGDFGERSIVETKKLEIERLVPKELRKHRKQRKQKSGKHKIAPHLWDSSRMSPGFQLSNGTMISGANRKRWGVALGQTVYTKGTHSFEVKVLATRSKHIQIGIAPADFVIPQAQEPILLGNESSYAYNCNTGAVAGFDIRCYSYGINEVIKVTVDMDNRTLQFTVNNVPLPKLSVSLPYPVSPAVALASGQMVEILGDNNSSSLFYTKKSTPLVFDKKKVSPGLELTNGNQLSGGTRRRWGMGICKTVFEKGVHSFEVKLLASRATRAIQIGVAPSKTRVPKDEKPILLGGASDSYGYNCNSGVVSGVGITTAGSAVGHIIKTTVDIDKRTLQFAVNGNALPKICIMIPGAVCPAVALASQDSVEILN